MANEILTLYQTRLARIETQLTTLYATYAELTATTTLSYGFDGADGSQRSTRRQIYEISNEIKRLEAEQESLISRINGCGGIVNIKLRRKI